MVEFSSSFRRLLLLDRISANIKVRGVTATRLDSPSPLDLLLLDCRLLEEGEDVPLRLLSDFRVWVPLLRLLLLLLPDLPLVPPPSFPRGSMLRWPLLLLMDATDALFVPRGDFQLDIAIA